MGKAAKIYRRPCESRDPYAVRSRLRDAANCLCYNSDRWLMGWTAPYGIDVPE